MPGYEFLIVVMFIGVVIFGFAGMVAWRARQTQWDAAERSGIRLALELSFATVLLALLPFPLYYLFESGGVVWRLASVFSVIFLFVEGAKTFRQMTRYGAKWPALMISLLVLSGILLTIEMVNIFWWGSLAVYAFGLMWIVGLAGVQYISFVCYDLDLLLQKKTHDSTQSAYAVHRAKQPGERVQRGSRADHPNGKAHTSTNPYRDPVSYARRQRYAHRLPLAHEQRSYRGPLSDAAFRADEDTQR